MPAEDHNEGRSPLVNPRNKAEQPLDVLAKELAGGTVSRGKALRLLGTALVGGVMASIPGVATAAKPAPCPPGVAKCGKNCCPDTTFNCSQGRCVCPAETTLINNSCCPNAQVCGSNCGCPPGKECVDGQCVCAGSCPVPGQVQDPMTCECACPAGQELCEVTMSCVSTTCGPNARFDPSTCQCECDCAALNCPPEFPFCCRDTLPPPIGTGGCFCCAPVGPGPL